MQRIIIKNFGPIPFCDLEINDFMIFIGQQSTGKSTICKCIHFFKSVRDEVISNLYSVLDNGIIDNNSIKTIRKKINENFVHLFGQTKFKKDFYIRFEYCNGIFIETTIAKDTDEYLNFNFSETLQNKINELKDIVINDFKSMKRSTNSDDLFVRLEKNKAFTIIKFELNKLFDDDKEIFYIPAGRGLLSLLTNNYLGIDLELLDSISGNFMKLVQKVRINFEKPFNDSPDLTLFDAVLETNDFKDSKMKSMWESSKKIKSEILEGEYLYDNGSEFIKLKNGDLIPVNYASSGQQEVLWILNLLQLWMLRSGDKNIFLVIEEPEAHLFPDTQKRVVQFISKFANNNNNQVLITTHSPYILTSINNLLYAEKVGKKKPKEVRQIIPQNSWLDIGKTAAYLVGGSKEYLSDIIDKESSLISAEQIDTVSNIINSEYEKIYNLED